MSKSTFNVMNYYIFTISTTNTDVCVTKIYSLAHVSVCIKQQVDIKWGRHSYNNKFAFETTRVFKIYIFIIRRLVLIIFNIVFKYFFFVYSAKYFLKLKYILIL